jgi:hypothetical protein
MLARTLFILFFCLVSTPSASAHNVKHDGDVGATFHIEPNHNPRAGEESLAWFALVRKDGKAISLEDCDCKLKVNLQTDGQKKTIATPNLQVISTENYRDIPSAKITFPQAGIYELSISGKPKSDKGFFPFVLDYQVVVSGNNVPAQDKHQHQQQKDRTEINKNKPNANDSSSNLRWIFGSLGGIITLICLIPILSKQFKK